MPTPQICTLCRASAARCSASPALDNLDRHAGHEGRSGDGRSPSIWLPDHGTECRGAADPPQGDAAHPADGGGNGCLDDRAVGRGGGVAEAAAGWGA